MTADNPTPNRYLDGFIAERELRGIPVTSELLQVNRKLKVEDEARYRYKHRDFWCKIGLHSRRQSVWGGSFLGTCVKCWREMI